MVQIIRRGWKEIHTNVFYKVHICLMVVEIGWLITSIIRVSDIANTPIGTSMAVTYISTIAYLTTQAVAFYIVFLFYSIHASILKATSHRKTFIRVSGIFFLICSIQPFMGLWGLYNPTEYGLILELFFISSAIGNWSYSLLAIIGFTPLIKVIDQSLKSYPEKSVDLAKTRWRISTVRRELTIEPFISGAIYLVFAFWPFLRLKVIYQYPVQVLLWLVMCFGISLMISTTSSGNSQVQNNTDTKDSSSKKVKQEHLSFQTGNLE